MATVTIPRELFEELVDSKIKYLSQRINDVLGKWHYSSQAQFLLDAANGTIEEAESDAISFRNLFDKREELNKIRYTESFK